MIRMGPPQHGHDGVVSDAAAAGSGVSVAAGSGRVTFAPLASGMTSNRRITASFALRWPLAKNP